MKKRSRQKGATLLVGMIMLVVLTLLVVFALRSSNTGIKIAGNLQARMEADGAALKAIETMIEEFKLAADVSLLNGYPASAPLSVQVGDKTFAVTVVKPTCEMEVPITFGELTEADHTDGSCTGEATSGAVAITASLAYADTPTNCKRQHWRIESALSDTLTGASVGQVQGIAVRVPFETTCP